MPRKLLPFTLVLSLVVCCIEVEVSVPGFPTMAHYFNVNEAMIQVSVTINLIAFGIAAWFYGPFSEAFGRRKALIFGNALMMLGAIGCSFSNSLFWLYLARFIQGLGAAGSPVLVFAIVADVYDKKQSVILFGLFNAILTSLMALAPVVGGFINLAIGWRGNFILLAFLSFTAWLAQLFILPETLSQRAIFKITKTVNDYHRLFRSINFLFASIIPSLFYAGYISFVTSAPFIYMNYFGCSLIGYTIQQAVIISAFTITSLCVKSILRFVNEPKALLSGFSISVAGVLMMLIFSSLGLRSVFLMSLAMCLYSIGSAICYPIIFAHSMEIFPEMKGLTSSFNIGVRAILIAVTVWVASLSLHKAVLGVAEILSIILGIIAIAIWKLFRYW